MTPTHSKVCITADIPGEVAAERGPGVRRGAGGAAPDTASRTRASETAGAGLRVCGMLTAVCESVASQKFCVRV